MRLAHSVACIRDLRRRIICMASLALERVHSTSSECMRVSRAPLFMAFGYFGTPAATATAAVIVSVLHAAVNNANSRHTRTGEKRHTAMLIPGLKLQHHHILFRAKLISPNIRIYSFEIIP